jgi:chorismate synthase
LWTNFHLHTQKMNTFGSNFRITTFGESHGEGIGVVIDGCPAGLVLDMEFVQNELDRRKPGQSAIVTQRKESDTVTVLSGVFQGYTTGTPLTFFIKNEDARSKDYSHLAQAFRPSHADFTYFKKYEGFNDYRGGGRSSARETAARVAAGAVAKLILQQYNIRITAYVRQVFDIKLEGRYRDFDFENIEKTEIRCPDLAKAQAMIAFIKQIKKQGDTVGGIIEGVIEGCPVGLGAPLFAKLHAQLGGAMLSIPAAKGFEYGSGFEGINLLGSAHNDVFYTENDEIRTKTNHSGGIQGGISNGMDIDFRVAFKPVATILQTQKSVDTNGNAVEIAGKGRHDPCVLPRAVPIVEAMAALVVVDNVLGRR